MTAPPTDPYRAVARPAEPKRRTSGRRVSLAVGAALGVVCILWVAELGAGALPMSLVWGLVLWLFLACTAFVVAAVIGRFAGFVPDLPGVPDGLNADRKLIAVAAAFVLLVTLAREGAFLPAFVLNLNWWDASHTVSRNSSSSSSSTSMGTGEVFYAGRPLHCSLMCNGDEVGCAVFRAIVTCDDREPEPGGVLVSIMLTIPEVSCYTPLAKSADVSYTAEVDLSVVDGMSRKSSGLSITGNVSQEMSGLASCYVFRQELAKVISREVTTQIDSHLAAN